MTFITIALKRVSDFFEYIASLLAKISVAVMIVVVILAVICRYIFKYPLPWADELALFMLLWSTFLGASLSIKKSEMIAATFLLDRLQGKGRLLADITIQILVLVLTIILFVYGFKWIMAPNTVSATSSALRIPMWIPYLIFPITMAFITVFSFEKIILRLSSK